MRIMKAENIKNLWDVEMTLNMLKPTNDYLDTIDEYSYEYDDICEYVQKQFCEILDALNLNIVKLTLTNIAIGNIMNMFLWDYLKGEITFDELIDELNKQYEVREV